MDIENIIYCHNCDWLSRDKGMYCIADLESKDIENTIYCHNCD